LNREISEAGSQVDMDSFTLSSLATIESRAAATRVVAPGGTTSFAVQVVPIVEPDSSCTTAGRSGYRNRDTTEPSTNSAMIPAIAAAVRQPDPVAG